MATIAASGPTDILEPLPGGVLREEEVVELEEADGGTVSAARPLVFFRLPIVTLSWILVIVNTA